MARRRRKRERSRPTRLLRTKRLLLGIVALLLLGGAGYGLHSFQMRRQATVLREFARKAAAENEPAQSVEFYKQYLIHRPQDVEALSELAGQYEELAKTKPAFAFDAISLLEEKVLSLEEHRHDDRRKLAKLYFQTGKFDRARAHLDQLLKADDGALQGDPELHLLLARCDRLEKKPEGARKAYERSIATNKAPASTSLEFGTYLRNEVKTPQAIADADGVMNRLIDKAPQDVEARLLRSRYRMSAGDRRGALEDIEVAYSQSSGTVNPDVILQLAALTAHDDPKRARDLLELALKSQPDNVLITLGVAELMVATNSEAEARRLLLDAARKLPDSDLRLLEVADRLIDVKEYDAALSTADRMAPNERIATAALYLRGRVAVLRGDWPSGIPLLQSSLAALSRNANLHKKAHLALGQAFAAAGDLPNRLRSYEAAVSIDSDSLAAQFGRAEALAEMGQTAKAAGLFRELAPKNALARVRYAKIKFAEIAGQPEASRNWPEFERALGAKPYPPEIEALAANALFLQKKPADAIGNLTATLAADPKRVQAWLTLALLRGLQDADSGLRTLDEAEKHVGDAVDLRLLRAQLLARNPKGADIRAIVALAEPAATPFQPAERFRLGCGLADLLVAHDRRPEAIAVLQKATAEMPFDLPSRLTLFDLANGLPNAEARDRALDEIRKLDGADGAVTIVAEVSRGFLQTPPADAATRATWASRLTTARTQRDSWGRIHVLLGDIAYVEGRMDPALADYRKAIDRGERNEALIRRVVQILWERQNTAEATQLLTRVAEGGGLPADLQRQYGLMLAALTDNKEQNLKWVRSKEATESKSYRDHLMRGTVFFIFGATDEAMAALQKAKSLKDDAPELWVTIVRFLAATGQKEAAQAQADAAQKRLREPDVKSSPAAIALAIGECREIVGDFATAEAEFKKAWELQPADPAVPLRLYALYQRVGKPKEAADLLTKAIDSGKREVVHWARRMRAVSAVSVTDGFKHVPVAVGWLDENLRDGGGTLEDLRAKAFVQAIDPFQRKKGIDALNETIAQSPLTAEQNFFLAKLYLQSNEIDLAMKALADAAKAGPLALPDHLALLAHLQLDRGEMTSARQTLNRLKLRAPNAWDTAFEEARYLAKDGRQAEAAKRILNFPWPGDPNQKLAGVGRALETIGSVDEAEKLYRTHAEMEKGPAVHVPLVQFLIRRGRSAEAIAILQGVKTSAPVGSTARLLSMSVRSRVALPVPASDKPAWDKSVAEIETWVAEKLKESPKSEDLLTASAELADSRGDYDGAIDYYRRASENSAPETRSVQLNNLAILTALHKKDGGAGTVKLIDEAIALRGPYPSLLDTRAIVRIAAGDYHEALRDLDAAAGADPRPVFQYHLALAYHKLGNAPARAAALAEARKRGLTEANLHPLEWDEYRRLIQIK